MNAIRHPRAKYHRYGIDWDLEVTNERRELVDTIPCFVYW
jgi:hypothetical protein